MNQGEVTLFYQTKIICPERLSTINNNLVSIFTMLSNWFQVWTESDFPSELSKAWHTGEGSKWIRIKNVFG